MIYYFFNRTERILTRKIAQRQGNGAEDLLIFENTTAVIKQDEERKMSKPCWEKVSAGPCFVVVVVGGPARKKAWLL